MNFKTTIALVVVALALGGAVFWQQREQGSATPTPITLPGAIFTDVRTGQVDRIEVRQGGQVGLAEKGENNEWRLVQPEASDANASRLDTLVSSFVNVRATRVLTDAASTPGNLAQYGLDQPEITVSASGKEIQPISLSVGREAPAGNARYTLKPGSNNVYLVSTSVVSDWLKLITDPPKATPTPAPTATPGA